MTKELLEQYPHICAEIEEIRSRNPTTDTVSGSSEDYPYTKHPVTVRGVSLDDMALLRVLEEQEEEIRLFVHSLPNSKHRRIVTMRAMQGMSWAQVAAKMGYRYSESGVKKLYQRAIKNYS